MSTVRLTATVTSHGCSCKVKQDELFALLREAGLALQSDDPTCSIGEDAVVRVINEQTAIVENVDVFTPIHDDPFIQGQIVACNASNDVFVMGVTDIISLQAFLAYPTTFPREIPVGVLRGMDSFMASLGVRVMGGQTITNPCPVFGGVCMGVARPTDIVHSYNARPGDVVVLTKPLGIQPAMRSYREMQQDERRDALLAKFSATELIRIQNTAVRIMTKSAIEVARAMRRVGVHAATDVTGFGLLGHAGNVARLSGVDVVFRQVPVIRGTLELAEHFGHRLAQGLGAETAGGVLVFMPPDRVDSFIAELEQHRLPCWTVGEAVHASKVPSARLAPDVQFIEADFPL